MSSMDDTPPDVTYEFNTENLESVADRDLKISATLCTAREKANGVEDVLTGLHSGADRSSLKVCAPGRRFKLSNIFKPNAPPSSRVADIPLASGRLFLASEHSVWGW